MAEKEAVRPCEKPQAARLSKGLRNLIIPELKLIKAYFNNLAMVETDPFRACFLRRIIR